MKNRYRFLAMTYGVLALIGCLGYFVDPKVTLVVAAGVLGAIGMNVMAKLYAFVPMGEVSQRARVLQERVTVVVGVAAAVGAVVLGLTSVRGEGAGALVAVAIYCWQEWGRERLAERVD